VQSHVQALDQCRGTTRRLGLRRVVGSDTAGSAAEIAASGDITRAAIASSLAGKLYVPAALYKALGGFATSGVNMTKLESYMVGGSFTATRFYADVEGHPSQRPLQLALEELRFYASDLRILGVYPAHPFRDRQR
jgi:prephenate dehydratase